MCLWTGGSCKGCPRLAPTAHIPVSDSATRVSAPVLIGAIDNNQELYIHFGGFYLNCL